MPCIKLLSGTSQFRLRDIPTSGSLMSQEYPSPKLYLWAVYPAWSCYFTRMGAQKNTKQKHINTYLTALAGQSSQERTPTRPRDKRDKMAILLWNSTENGWFVPGTGPMDRSWFVTGTGPVCPEHRPARNGYVYWFFSSPMENLSPSILTQTCLTTVKSAP